jgi:UDP-glucose 4-epimerase
MRSALVLGGNGFIGYHLVCALMNSGWQVTVYDRAIRSRFSEWNAQPSYIRGELGNRELVREHLTQTDTVFHLAYTTIPKTSNDDPVYDIQSNVTTTVNMLTECVRANVRRVVFLSSGGTVYGMPKQLPVPESHPTEPICSYGITKLMIERYLFLFRCLYGLSYSIVRPSNPYGEQQNILGEQGAVGVFLGRIARGHPIVIWGDGSVTRDYLYVGDLVRACVMAAQTDIPDLLVNIGSGEELSLNDLLQIIRDTIGVTFAVEYQAGRPFDVLRLALDITRARQVLGWEPTVSMTFGIKRTWNWIRDQLQLHPGKQI